MLRPKLGDRTRFRLFFGNLVGGPDVDLLSFEVTVAEVRSLDQDARTAIRSFWSRFYVGFGERWA